MILAIFDHLWQSTLFTVAMTLLVLTMRNNRANARFCLWLAASLKFLVPFSLLIAVGEQLGWTGLSASPQWTLIIFDIARPSSIFSVWSATHLNTSHSYGLYVVMAVWSLGFVAVITRRTVEWKRIKAVVRTATPVDLGVPIDTRFSATALEPGVVGIKNAVLLLPKDIETRLTPAQLRGVLDHELCHARRHDNLTSALHMVVEALLWFYPLIWWLGTRLIEERERACDEAVLRRGNEPHDYAEGILRVCKAYVGSPLVCTSGVSGGDLTKRIESIMRNQVAANLSVTKRFLLGVACTAALLGPVAVGLLDARPAHAQSKPIVGQLPSRVRFEDSAIRIYADNVQKSGNSVRYSGNVMLEALSGNKGLVKLSARRASDLSGDTVAEGDLRVDAKPSGAAPVSAQARKPMLLEGVELEIDGRTFITERAMFSPPRLKMDAVEVVLTSTSKP